ncbi:hypothetical protein SO802_029171 [Lithocarpus litseifolius]|uniref:Uncharacterized protein n=1 Tax=Lithocarpus litseifolius TaxID=425828 RepID=A0AAW2BSX1_9ROSI
MPLKKYTHIYFNIHNPQDSGFIYDYDDLIYPVPSQNASKQENGSYPIMSDIFHTQTLFTDLYTQMEKEFKIYEYQDEDLNMYYKSPMKYSNEGFFFNNNLKESQFLTTNPDEAHLFFVPFSSHRMKGN